MGTVSREHRWFFVKKCFSDKSAVDVVGDLDVDDCATGSFCSSCAIPPRVVGGLWSDGVGCDACCYPFGVLRLRESG